MASLLEVRNESDGEQQCLRDYRSPQPRQVLQRPGSEPVWSGSEGPP